MPVCVKKERSGQASADQGFFYSQPRQLPCARHSVLKPAHLLLSHLFCQRKTYLQNGLHQLITWSKLQDEYTHYQWLKYLIKKIILFLFKKQHQCTTPAMVNLNFKNAILETEPLTYVITCTLQRIILLLISDIGSLQNFRYIPHLRLGVYLLQTSTLVSSIAIFIQINFIDKPQ